MIYLCDLLMSYYLTLDYLSLIFRLKRQKQENIVKYLAKYIKMNYFSIKQYLQLINL